MPDKILVVDDDIETLRLVGLMLQRQGFQVVAANNGVQALAQSAREQPDLVVLDLMMPDLDGYQVARQLRKQSISSATLILMFSAKAGISDKVAGYDAGADDYMTKPVHPVELLARIKTLLARKHTPSQEGLPKDKQAGYAVGVIAAKGGMGVSSLVLNLGISLYQKHKTDLIAAELRPGNGTWGIDLGVTSPAGLNNLLCLKPADITASAVENELVRITQGVRLLMSSSTIHDIPQIQADHQMEIVVQQLTRLAPLVLLDIGNPIQPSFYRITRCLQEIIMVTEPYPGTVQHTRLLIDELAKQGFDHNRQLTVVVINRVRADNQLSISEVQEALGHRVTQVFSPAPEQAFQAGKRKIPLIEAMPESLLSQQFNQMAENIYERIQV